MWLQNSDINFTLGKQTNQPFTSWEKQITGKMGMSSNGHFSTHHSGSEDLSSGQKHHSLLEVPSTPES